MLILQDLLQQADSYKEKISSALPQTEEESKIIDDHFRAGFIHSSNALDGNALTLSETKTLLENGGTVPGRSQNDCNEVLGYNAAYGFMLELAGKQDMDITEETIRKLHRLIYQKADPDQGGQYRTAQVTVTDAEHTPPVTGQGTEHTPPAPGDIPRFINHLADQIRSSRSTLHPIELAAMTNKRLLDIHPFISGNGRTARLLMNLILVHAGYGVVSISPILGNDYIRALSDSRRLNDMDPFSTLIAKCVIEAEQDRCHMMKL